MIYKTFEEYLVHRCFEENPTVLDDDMSDFFTDWLGDQNIDAVMIYADGWMRDTKHAIAADVRQLFNTV